MREEHLPHEAIVLDHLKQVDDVEIAVQHFNAFIKIDVLFGRFNLFQLRWASASETAEIVAQGQARVVREA